MLTQQHVEEALSRAHIEAVAANAHVAVHYRGGFDYGVDGTFHPIQVVNKRRIEAGYPIDFQAKATTSWSMDGSDIVYDAEAQAYNDIVERAGRPAATPLILILLILPSDATQWLQLTTEFALMRHCCYWSILTGAAQTANTSSKRIRIPTTNHFTSAALSELVARRRQGTL